MSDEQINIAIAEACGVDLEKYRTYEGDINVSALKKYCNDLNAMHEAENVLTYEQQVDYSIAVGKLATSHLPASRAAWLDYKIIHVTARQKAEAFLKTLGKWEGAK